MQFRLYRKYMYNFAFNLVFLHYSKQLTLDDSTAVMCCDLLSI